MNKMMPVLLTRGITIFKNSKFKIEIGREISINTVELAKEQFSKKIIIAFQKDIHKDDIDTNNVYEIAWLASFNIEKKWTDGTFSIKIKPLKKVKVKNLSLQENPMFKEPILFGNYSIITNKINPEKIAELDDILKKIISFIDKNTNDDLDQGMTLNEILMEKSPKTKIGMLDYYVESFFEKMTMLNFDQKMILVQKTDLLDRLKLIYNMIKNLQNKSQSETVISTENIENQINKKIKDKFDKQQKEFYLREKLKAIKEELNEDDSFYDSSLKSYLKRIEKEPFPENIKAKVKDLINKLETIQVGSSEYNIEKNYLDWIMSIPWWEETKDVEDLNFAKKILDKYHFGLEKVKERIIEYIAVKQKTKKLKGPIITLVGPPGVGKTSLAKSIAEALGKKFVKISLGGVKDESEIRGHRKTYIGALPGRIIQSMKRAKVKNPLCLLDEIDKMSSDYKGDPSSAMLEVLDSEQNNQFSDHYIEEPYDLSNVMFIATANYADDIPDALYDRMECIYLSSYTEIEKLSIAKKYLISKILKEHEVSDKELKFEDSAIEEIIKYYTREAGVRQLERLISKITRKFVVKLINNELKTLTITKNNVVDFLDKRIFDYTKKQKKSEIGVVTGLAYTSFGGDILPIEINVFPGKGNLTLTGKLGEVMKESATIALAYVKSNFKKYNINKDILEDNDIHMHVPEGAVPKDGPSAGITITTALISALSSKPVSKEVGMTGEITLRGNVLPIGGLREKSISAARSGLKTILIPKNNTKDIEDIPKEIQKKLNIIPVSTYEEVYNTIFKN